MACIERGRDTLYRVNLFIDIERTEYTSTVYTRRIHQDTPCGYTRRIHQDTPGYAKIHQDTPGYAKIHHDTLRSIPTMPRQTGLTLTTNTTHRTCIAMRVYYNISCNRGRGLGTQVSERITYRYRQPGTPRTPHDGTPPGLCFV